MQTQALLLNADYRPLKVIPWERVVTLMLDAKADLVEEYVGLAVRSASMTLAWPSVVRLRKFVHRRGRVRFKRDNVFSRDSHTCQYCGVSGSRSGLTLDHVVPRAQSRGGRVELPWSGKSVCVTGWWNIVTCCQRCNLVKRDRTPEQAGMRLKKYPRPPGPIDVLRMSLTKVTVPEEWEFYLGSE